MILKLISFYVNPNFRFPEESDFFKTANFVAWKYYNELQDVNIKNLRKITIELKEQIKNVNISEYNKIVPVCIIELPYKFDEFHLLNSQERRLNLLNTLYSGVKLAVNKFNWSLDPFKKAYEVIIRNGFENSFTISKKLSSPDRKFNAQALVNANETYAEILVSIKGKLQSKANNISIIKIVPDPLFLDMIFKKIVWLNNYTMAVQDSFQELTFKINVESGIKELVLVPSIHSLEYIEDTLKIVDPFLDRQIRLDILNKRIS